MKRLSKATLTIIISIIFFAFLLLAYNGTLSAEQSNTSKTAITTKVTPEQQGFINAHPSLNIVWNAGENVPYSLRGFNKYVTGDKTTAALNFLEEIKYIFKMKDAASEMSLRMVQDDDLGYQHIRFYQQYNGLRVIGGELIVHINNKKQIYQVNGEYYPEINISTSPSISADASLAPGLKDFQDKYGFKIEKTPELVVYGTGIKQYTLAYNYILFYDNKAGDIGRWVYFVDAGTGRIIKKYNDIKYFRKKDNESTGDKNSFFRPFRNLTFFHQPTLSNTLQSIAPPTPSGSTQDMTGSILAGEGGGSVTVQGWADTTNDADYLYNKTLFWYIYNISTTGAYNLDYNTFAYRTGATHNWGTTDRVEMSAANNINFVQDYFKTVHSRNSYDAAGAFAIVNVHVTDVGGVPLVNAYWDGTSLNIGDGDGIMANSLAVLDIMAHEFGHAWTEKTSNLDYLDESGALNESFSDIIGATVEFWAQPDGRAIYPGKTAGAADWLLGEDCWLSSTAIRDMRNPSNTATVGAGNEQPSHYHGKYWYDGPGDNGGVHQNSGPQNFLYYLLSDGNSGTNDSIPYNITGIGITNARLVAYRANTHYLTTSNGYVLARAAWISAATDINASWVDNVSATWDAVGVIDLPTPQGQSFENITSLPFGWSTGGSANWAVSTVTARDGGHSLKAGTIGNSQTTWVQKIINPPAAGFLSFFILVSSEQGYDFANFYIDGSLQATWSGTTASWTPYLTYLTAGMHTLRWEYTKDISDSNGSDTVYLDALTYVPETPTLLSATGVNSVQVTLEWSKNSVGGFKIERKTGSGGSYSEIGTTTSNETIYRDIGLTTGTEYYYRVKASNAYGDSSYTSEVNATPIVTLPAVPTFLTATSASATQINLSWTANSTNESGFKIERKTGVSGTYSQIHVSAAGETTYNDTGLTTGTTYYYQVRATNVDGDSAYSNEANATPAIPAPPGPTPATPLKSGNMCFIATAAFGSPMEHHVKILRDFRDHVLLNSSVGKDFVDFYYRTSPPIADKIAQSEALRFLTRIVLMPVIGVAYLIVHLGMLTTLLLFTIMFLTVAFTIRIFRKKVRTSARAQSAA